MAYPLPKPHPVGEKWLNDKLKTYRDLQQSISFVDTDVPGMRAVVTRFTAFVGCNAPLPSEYPTTNIVSRQTTGRKRRVETLFLASVIEACQRYDEAVVDMLTTDEIRKAFMVGLFSPVVWCFLQKIVPVTALVDGVIWSVAELAPYCDIAPDSPPEDWKIASVTGVDPRVAIRELLTFCCEPEYPHWVEPMQTAIIDCPELIVS